MNQAARMNGLSDAPSGGDHSHASPGITYTVYSQHMTGFQTHIPTYHKGTSVNLHVKISVKIFLRERSIYMIVLTPFSTQWITNKHSPTHTPMCTYCVPLS